MEITLSQLPYLWLWLTLGIGLIVGSFLNVLIYRFPQMLQRYWLAQCHLFMAEQPHHDPPASDQAPPAPFNLCWPASHCPHCAHSIPIWHNIPLLSFLWLKGRCHSCQHPISWRYPVIELLTTLCTVIVVAHFGIAWLTLGALLLTWSLIALSFIDFDHKILPDELTLSMLWLGLLLNTQHTFVSPQAAILGAALGYLTLFLLFWLYKLFTGKEGMGYGDFKLYALLGAWSGWQSLPFTLFMASVLGAMVGIFLIVIKGYQRSAAIPFGPYLALAGWLNFMWGDIINAVYLMQF
jgi:leader peptidase (prepilin peptidase)/N-methyltransferase